MRVWEGKGTVLMVTKNGEQLYWVEVQMIFLENNITWWHSSLFFFCSYQCNVACVSLISFHQSAQNLFTALFGVLILNLRNHNFIQIVSVMLLINQIIMQHFSVSHSLRGCGYKVQNNCWILYFMSSLYYGQWILWIPFCTAYLWACIIYCLYKWSLGRFFK